jgi:hypothetical protein
MTHLPPHLEHQPSKPVHDAAKPAHEVPNPEAEASKTVERFREVANGQVSMQAVWGDMYAATKTFGRGSTNDHAYFKAVDAGLQKNGLLPELSIKYAQWHKDDLCNDNGQIGPKDIREWSYQRQMQNGRVTEVEGDFINHLATNYKDMYKTGSNLAWDSAPVITDNMLVKLDQKYADDRHKVEAAAEEKTEDRTLAAGLLQNFTANGNALFNKLSQSNGGRFIDQASIDAARDYDLTNRQRAHIPGQPWHSYLGYQDHIWMTTLASNIERLSHGGGRVVLGDLQAFARQQGL